MAVSRRFVPHLFGALVAVVAACKDPHPTTGSLQIEIDGLPAGGAGKVVVTGPDRFSQIVTTTTTLSGLQPGEYRTRIDSVTHENDRYGAAVVLDTFEVVAGQTDELTATYSLASGSINFTVTGVPPGASADIRLVAPSMNITATGSGIVHGLPPGKIYIHTDTFSTMQGDRLGSPKIKDSVTLTASATPVPVTVNYTTVSGTLTLTVNGMPSSLPQSQQPITVTGPSGYLLRTTGTGTLRGLVPGSYTVNAAKASGTCPAVYKTTTSAQTVAITAGQTNSVTVNYTESVANPAELNLKIEKVEIIQVTQDEIGSVPMVANRKALVRVYGLADQCNTATPNVSLTLSTAAGAKVLAAPEQSVRYHTEVGTLHSTWNYTTEASEIANGLTLVAEIDPGNAVQEANDSDNRYPASGSMAVTVRQVPVLGIRLVPVVNGQRTGSIQPDVIMELARKVHPVPGYDVTVRAPYTTSAGALTAQGGNWAEVLTEIDALRFADNSNRYYYGMLRVNFEDGVAGIAFVRNCTTPPPETKTDCKAAIGWDHPQTAAEVLAHEVGHNFERNHAPSSVCNQVPQQIDFTYPNTGLYAGGRIGQYGYDVETQQLKPPEHFNDVMGYCHNLWISDHMYRGMLNYVSDPNRAGTLPSIVSSGAGEPSLLIWGRIVGGTPVLEPAFEITTRPSLPPAGPHRLALLDERGAEIYGVSFAARVIGDLPGGGEGFAFAVPLSALRGRSPASMRLTARGRTVTTPRSGELSDDPGIVARRTAPDRVHLRWDATRFPVAMVRDARSGEVLSFARGGDATIAATRDDLEVSFSNRVRSARRTVPVRRE